jgi:hypothetical protein
MKSKKYYNGFFFLFLHPSDVIAKQNGPQSIISTTAVIRTYHSR